jgi:hypothetical protein
MTPLQKFQFAISDEIWSEAVAAYKGLAEAEKTDAENRYLYATALLKSNQEAAGMKELESMYAAKKEARIGLKLAESLIKKAKKASPDSYNAAIDMFLETGLLYQKEGNAKNGQAALAQAKFELGNKYGYNDAARKVNAEAENAKKAAGQNQAKVRKLENDIRLEERRIRKAYGDQEPPEYEYEKIEKMKKQLVAAKSGASTQTTDAAEKLTELMKQIESEYNSRLAEARNRTK